MTNKTQKFEHVDSSGEVLGVWAHHFTNAAERVLFARGSHSYMRTRRFAVVLCANTLVLSRDYERETPEQYKRATIAKGSKFWESHKRDRLSQLWTIERHLNFFGHPWEDELRRDIADERKRLNG